MPTFSWTEPFTASPAPPGSAVCDGTVFVSPGTTRGTSAFRHRRYRRCGFQALSLHSRRHGPRCGQSFSRKQPVAEAISTPFSITLQFFNNSGQRPETFAGQFPQVVQRLRKVLNIFRDIWIFRTNRHRKGIPLQSDSLNGGIVGII